MNRPIDELLQAWRKEAEKARGRGFEPYAKTVETMAEELEEWWDRWAGEELTVQEVMEATGWSESTVYRKKEVGELVDVGKKGAPRFARWSVPIRLRPSRREDRPEDGSPGEQLVRSVLRGHRRRGA